MTFVHGINYTTNNVTFWLGFLGSKLFVLPIITILVPVYHAGDMYIDINA